MSERFSFHEWIQRDRIVNGHTAQHYALKPDAHPPVAVALFEREQTEPLPDYRLHPELRADWPVITADEWDAIKKRRTVHADLTEDGTKISVWVGNDPDLIARMRSARMQYLKGKGKMRWYSTRNTPDPLGLIAELQRDYNVELGPRLKRRLAEPTATPAAPAPDQRRGAAVTPAPGPERGAAVLPPFRQTLDGDRDERAHFERRDREWLEVLDGFADGVTAGAFAAAVRVPRSEAVAWLEANADKRVIHPERGPSRVYYFPRPQLAQAA